MTLEFHPYFQPDRNQDRESLANINQTVSGIGDDWQKYGQQNRTNKIQDSIMALRQQQAQREQQDWNRENVDTLPMQGDQRTGSIDMTPHGTESWSPSTLDLGRQPFSQSTNYSQPRNAPAPFQAPQMPEALHAPGTDLTSHFNAWKQQGGGSYSHPEMSGQMSDANNPMAQWNQYSQIPGSKNRSEKMLFDKEQSQMGLNQAEMNQKNSMADYYGKKDPNKSPNSIASTTWEGATPQQQAVAIALVNGEIRPADIGFKEKGVIVSLAKEYADANGIPFTSYEGDVKRGMAENAAYGKAGDNVTSLNTALGHAADALQSFEEVKNTNAKWLNQPINRIISETNDPSVVALNLNLVALRGELETAFRNGGNSEHGIETWAKSLNDSLTPAQYYSAAKKINALLTSRIAAQQHRYSNVMNNNIAGRQLMSPHSEELGRKLSTAGENRGEQGPPGKIKVSNGQRSFWIDPLKAADAAKDGYQ